MPRNVIPGQFPLPLWCKKTMHGFPFEISFRYLEPFLASPDPRIRFRSRVSRRGIRLIRGCHFSRGFASGIAPSALHPGQARFSRESACLGHRSIQRRQCMQSGLRKTPPSAASGGKKPNGQAFAQSPQCTHESAMRMPLRFGRIILYILPIGQIEHQKYRLKTSHPTRPTVVVMAIMI